MAITCKLERQYLTPAPRYPSRRIVIRIVATLLLLDIAPGISHGDWIMQNSTTVENLRGVCFVDSLEGWAVGDSGIILHTVTGGMEWVRQESPVSFKLFDVDFLNTNEGWAVGHSTILKTSNGGSKWERVLHDTSDRVYFKQIQSMSAGHAIALRDCVWSDISNGTTARLWETTDGGMFWTNVIGVFGDNIVAFNFKFVTDSIGWLCTQDDLAQTTDGGSTWTWAGINRPSFSVGFFAVAFSDVSHGWALADSLFRTVDRGVSWFSTAPVLWDGAYLPDMRFFGDTGFVVSNHLFRTDDGGLNFSDLSTTEVRSLGGMFFLNPSVGWVVGDRGLIAYTETGGLTSVSGRDVSVPATFSLHQNYPNPFNPSTTIKFDLPQSSNVRLSVFDLLGREVSVLVNEKIEAGYHSVEFNASNLSSGVYFYRLQAGDIVQTRKLLLIR
jgi:photosystem II stability/assembly factor-like uncharacterized protein